MTGTLTSISVLIAACTQIEPSAAPATLDDSAYAPHIMWEQMGEHYDETCFVYGKIAATGKAGNWIFLNFHENFRDKPVAVVATHNVSKFPSPPDELYRGKFVRIYGKIEKFKNKPEIKIAAPDQITVLDKLPTAEELTALQPKVLRPQPAVKDALADGALTIATYNIENLFDSHDDPYTEDENTPTKPASELEKLAATIRQLDADVLALQEVENRGVLEQFVRKMLPDLGYQEIVLQEGNDTRGIDVALLSRLPVGNVISHRHLSFASPNGATRRFERDALQVKIPTPGGPTLQLIVLHLKSKHGGETPESLDIRMAEATAVRGLVDQILADDPQAHVAVLGDLNDTRESQPILTLIGAGPTALTCPADALSPEDRATYRNPDYKSMIDYILCSPTLAARNTPGSYKVIQVPDGQSGSDHNPVSVTFQWKADGLAESPELIKRADTVVLTEEVSTAGGNP